MNSEENNQEVVADTETSETEVENTDENVVDKTDDTVTLSKEEFEKLNKTVGSLKREVKDLTKQTQETGENTDPDKALLEETFFTQKGLDHPEDREWVKKEAKAIGKTWAEVMQFPYAKDTLQTNKEVREAKAGMPHGSERGSGSGVNSVEYHLAKGTTPKDQALAEKVVEARMGQSQNDKFDPIPDF